MNASTRQPPAALPWVRASRLGFALLALAGATSLAPLASCSRPPETRVESEAPGARSPQPWAANPSQESRGPLVVFLGDSLTAGLELEEHEAYPARVRELLRERGLEIRVVNAGVSGDTSAGARARLDWVLRLDPAILVLAIGANDGLRGQSLESLEANLRAILRRARERGVPVLLAGQRLPTSYGRDYAEGFAAIYPRLAHEEGAHFLPFLLEGVAMVPERNLPDGIHPNAEGHRHMAFRVAAALEPLLSDSNFGAGGPGRSSGPPRQGTDPTRSPAQ